MRYSQALIDQVIDRTDLVQLIDTHVKLKKSGGSYTACCPFHQEKTPSFHVSPQKGLYYCFGCHASGNALTFLMEYGRLGFLEALEQLAHRAGITLPKEDALPSPTLQYTRKPLKARQPIPSTHPATVTHVQPAPVMPAESPGETKGDFFELLERVGVYYQSQLQKSFAARQYLQHRGVKVQSIHDWRLGYAPDGWQHLLELFPEDEEGLLQLGLLRKNESGQTFCLLRDRIIFPIRDGKGRIAGFGGRALATDAKPKYINSPESVIFNKSRLLYGLFEGKRQKASDWLLVEGYMDVITLHQAGFSGAVASLGTATNAGHLDLLLRLAPKLTLAFDGDAAGQKAAWRTMELALPLMSDGRELRFLQLPAEHDPDSILKQHGRDYLAQKLAEAPALSDFVFMILSRLENLDRPEGKSNLMARAQPIIDLLPPKGTYRHLLRQSLRERIGLNFRKNAPVQQDNFISFDLLGLEERCSYLLLMYPELASHFQHEEIMEGYGDRLLGQLLAALTFPQGLALEDYLKSHFLLGWMYNSPHYEKMRSWYQQLSPENILGNTERIVLTAQDYAFRLRESYLKQQLKRLGSQDVNLAKNWQDRLLELQKHYQDKLSLSSS